MVTGIVGDNWYAVKSAVSAISSDFQKQNGDMGLTRMYAPDISLDEILQAVGSVSLFAEQRMVVISDLSQNKQAAESFQQIFDVADDSVHLVVVETQIDKRSIYYKSLKKLKNYQEYSELNDVQLQKWVQEYTVSLGGSIGSTSARRLIERVGTNQTTLERELVKLVRYNPEISQESIMLLTIEHPSSTIFQLVDMAFSGNLAAALRLYDEQRVLRKEPQAIFGMLVWQMHLVALCASATGKSAADIAAETGLKSFSIGKAQAISSRMGYTKIKRTLDDLRDMEIKSKRQTYNLDDGLKYILQRLAY